MKDHLIAPELVTEELRRAGFEVARVEDRFVPRRKVSRQDCLVVAVR